MPINYEQKIRELRELQRHYRSKKAYGELSEGARWRRVLPGAEQGYQEFKELSRANINRLKSELGALTAEEQKFAQDFQQQPLELAHNAPKHLKQKIVKSGHLKSSSVLRLRSSRFHNNSSLDDMTLNNKGFVFSRASLCHDTTKTSRFGSVQYIFDGRAIGVLDYGWTSLFEMLQPDNISCVQKVTFEGRTVRELAQFFRDDSSLIFRYENGSYHAIDLLQTVFYGPDIMEGLALSLILELRFIGGDFQQKFLNDLSTDSFNELLKTLFRVEAKMPGAISLERGKYKVIDPEEVTAIITQNPETIEAYFSQENIPINSIGISEKFALFELCALADDAGLPLLPFFKSKGALFVDKQGNSAAHVALNKSNLGCLEYCLSVVSKNQQNNEGKTLVHLACENNQPQILDLLLDKNPDLTLQDNNQATALHYLAKKGNLTYLRKILDRAPQIVNQTDGNGLTALCHAAIGGHLEAVKLLYEEYKAALIDEESNSSKALSLAIAFNQEACVMFMLSCPEIKAILNNRIHEDYTPFLLAVSIGNISVVRELIALGSDLHASTAQGKNIFHLATTSQMIEELFLHLRDQLPEMFFRRDINNRTVFKGNKALLLKIAKDYPVVFSNLSFEDLSGSLSIYFCMNLEKNQVLDLLKNPKIAKAVLNYAYTNEDKFAWLLQLVKEADGVILNNILREIPPDRSDTGINFLQYLCVHYNQNFDKKGAVFGEIISKLVSRGFNVPCESEPPPWQYLKKILADGMGEKDLDVFVDLIVARFDEFVSIEVNNPELGLLVLMPSYVQEVFFEKLINKGLDPQEIFAQPFVNPEIRLRLSTELRFQKTEDPHELLAIDLSLVKPGLVKEKLSTLMEQDHHSAIKAILKKFNEQLFGAMDVPMQLKILSILFLDPRMQSKLTQYFILIELTPNCFLERAELTDAVYHLLIGPQCEGGDTLYKVDDFNKKMNSYRDTPLFKVAKIGMEISQLIAPIPVSDEQSRFRLFKPHKASKVGSNALENQTYCT